jgi:hypothetical protein
VKKMKVAAAGVVALICLVLAGCADQTGEIDTMGHNGYDRDTCRDSKAFALDVMYGTVSSASWRQRIQDISGEMKKASDADIRTATDALIAGYQSGNRTAVRTAVVSLVKACQI